jgi:hypothetical protein
MLSELYAAVLQDYRINHYASIITLRLLWTFPAGRTEGPQELVTHY